MVSITKEATLVHRELDRGIINQKKVADLFVKWNNILGTLIEYDDVDDNARAAIKKLSASLTVIMQTKPTVLLVELIGRYGYPINTEDGRSHLVSYLLKVNAQLTHLINKKCCRYIGNTHNSSLVRYYTAGFCWNVFGRNCELLLMDDVKNPIEVLNKVTSHLNNCGPLDFETSVCQWGRPPIVPELGEICLIPIDRRVACALGAGNLIHWQEILTNDFTTYIIHRHGSTYGEPPYVHKSSI